MKLSGYKHGGWLAVVILFTLPVMDQAQQKSQQKLPIGGTAKGFNSDMYFAPPDEQHIQMKLSGDSVSPLPDGAQDVRNLKIERFDVKGKAQMIMQAPQCTYALLDGVASSPGHFQMQTGDGKMRVEGDGFLWRQDDNSLTISNNVHTVIKTGFLRLTGP